VTSDAPREGSSLRIAYCIAFAERLNTMAFGKSLKKLVGAVGLEPTTR
jgi:hypothetical protein